MKIKSCSNCGNRVIPKADGTCPSCYKVISGDASPGNDDKNIGSPTDISSDAKVDERNKITKTKGNAGTVIFLAFFSLVISFGGILKDISFRVLPPKSSGDIVDKSSFAYHLGNICAIDFLGFAFSIGSIIVLKRYVNSLGVDSKSSDLSPKSALKAAIIAYLSLIACIAVLILPFL